MISLSVLENKPVLIRALSATRGNLFQRLLGGLSAKELKILHKHGDLIDRVSEISKMARATLLSVIKEDYGLAPENYYAGGIWISTEALEDSIPDWHKSTHSGWYLANDEFEAWARRFLMQEVRINIWLRHVEDEKNSDRQETSPRYYPGMHL